MIHPFVAVEPPNDEVMTFPRLSKTQVLKKAENEDV